VTIASKDGGSKALQAVIDLQPSLTKIGFNNKDIVNIAANGGGSKKLHSILKNKSKITDKNIKDIIKKLPYNNAQQFFENLTHKNNDF
jgi:hypothetical protein